MCGGALVGIMSWGLHMVDKGVMGGGACVGLIGGCGLYMVGKVVLRPTTFYPRQDENGNLQTRGSDTKLQNGISHKQREI